MTTRTKLVILELLGGIFGWGWIVASVAAIYFLVSAVAFAGAWSPFFWSLGISIVSKWLTRGINDNRTRVAYEAELVSRRLSPQDAAKAWVTAYSGGHDMLAELEQREAADTKQNGDAA